MINSKNVFLFSTIFIAIFLKYYSMWNYLFIGEFEISIIGIICFIIAIFFSIFNMNFEKKKLKNILILFIIAILMIIVNPKIDFLFSIIIATVFAVEKNGDKKFIKYYFISSISLFIITILMYILKILPSNNSARILDSGVVTRYSFGFAGINILFLCLVPIIASFLIYRSNYIENNKVQVAICTLIVSFLFYKITLCRTGFIITIIIVCMILCMDKISNSIYEKYIKYSFLLLTIISIYFASNYLYFNKINLILSNRLLFWNKYVDSLSVSFFGHEVLKGFPLDNVYLTHIYIDGFFISILYIFFNYVTGSKLSTNKIISAMFIVFSIYGLFENNYSYQYNFILILQFIYFIDISKSQSLLKNPKKN